MLTTRRMEHGIPLLADFDLGTLMGAQEKLQQNDVAALGEVLKVLASAGKTKAIRRISAVVHATEEQLRLAESDPTVMPALEEESALRSCGEAFKDAVGFFAEWGASFTGGLGSSAPAKPSPSRKAAPVGSPSAASSHPFPEDGKPPRLSRRTKP